MKKLAALRKARGLSQKELAKMVGVSQTTIASWEIGTREPNIAKLIQMAEIFGCTVDELIKKEDT